MEVSNNKSKKSLSSIISIIEKEVVKSNKAELWNNEVMCVLLVEENDIYDILSAAKEFNGQDQVLDSVIRKLVSYVQKSDDIKLQAYKDSNRDEAMFQEGYAECVRESLEVIQKLLDKE